MAELVANCPRCGSRHVTFDVTAHVELRRSWDWQLRFEAFGVCRHCHKSTVHLLSLRESQGDQRTRELKEVGPSGLKHSLNDLYDVDGYIGLKDMGGSEPPEHLPDVIAAAFKEGSTSHVTQCWNAAGTMFRLCVDLATRTLLPPDGTPGGPNAKERRDLGLRIPWLFDNGKLPADLRDLSSCIKDDGNDGAHHGTLTKVEAEDLQDFAATLLERLFTEPARVKLAQSRRDARKVKRP